MIQTIKEKRIAAHTEKINEYVRLFSYSNEKTPTSAYCVG
jgi:hypothetical protein